MIHNQIEEFRQTLGRGLRQARRSADMSQKDVGSRLHPQVSRVTVSERELGTYPVPFETVIEVAEITGASVVEIIRPCMELLQGNRTNAVDDDIDDDDVSEEEDTDDSVEDEEEVDDVDASYTT